MQNKVFGLLGLANRGGNLLIGEALFAKKGNKRIYLILLAKDASEPTKKKIYDKSTFANIEVVEDYDKASLGQSLGYHELSFIGVIESHLAKKVIDIRKESLYEK